MIIAIDPDLDKSGVAIFDDSGLKLDTMNFVGVMELLKGKNSKAVIIEAGWHNQKSNFHKKQGQFVREKIAKNVGENHAVGKIMVQLAEYFGHQVRLVTPKYTKLNHDEFVQLTGYQGKTNSEKRDAGRLAWQYRHLLRVRDET